MRRATIFRGTVVRVIDGDTFVLVHQCLNWDIRLFGIDAPEKGQAFFYDSQSFLRELIIGDPVVVTVMRKDRYGRLVCVVHTQEGRDVGLQMLTAGMAWYCDHYGKEASYHAAGTQALVERKGLFVETRPIAPWVFREQQKKKL